LPDPDGPHTTTTSPRLTVAVQSRRTCGAPIRFLHLLEDDHRGRAFSVAIHAFDSEKQIAR
jgi:hypothetical protein